MGTYLLNVTINGFPVLLLPLYSHMGLCSFMPNWKSTRGTVTLTNGSSSRYNPQRFQPALHRHDKDWNGKASRRGRLDITAEILLFCEQPKTKTSIMYNANLNYAQLKRHMAVLTTQKLLSKKTNLYSTTEKGHEFVELFIRLNGLVDGLTP
jgi:predicted transcriptional regulator